MAPLDAAGCELEVDGAVLIAVAVAAATASGVPAGTKRAFCLPPNTLNKVDFDVAAILYSFAVDIATTAREARATQHNQL
jgi:hypothetical protein